MLFPNPIIIALPSTVRFTCSRGPNVSDGIAASGTLEIPLPTRATGANPAGSSTASSAPLRSPAARRQDFPVPVNAFVADSVDLQRDQFLRINNTKPLPRGLVTELLPKISTPLPPRLSLRKTPSALCDLLNTQRGIAVPRPDPPPLGQQGAAGRRQWSPTPASSRHLQESLTISVRCLFPYRNLSSGETDFAGIWAALRAVLDRGHGTLSRGVGQAPGRRAD